MVCTSRRQIQFQLVYYYGVGQKKCHLIFFRVPIFFPLWILASDHFENIWDQWVPLLENILVRIRVCAEKRSCMYFRGTRRNHNRNIQVPVICWSQISALKRTKALHIKRRSCFSIARVPNLFSICSGWQLPMLLLSISSLVGAQVSVRNITWRWHKGLSSMLAKCSCC